MNKTKENKKELIENLEIQVKKLSILLADSNMPQDVKESWLAILPKMSLAQIDKFLHILETKFLNEETKSIDEEFVAKSKEIIKQHEEKQEEIDKAFLNNIESLT
ncbi:hypothetical protein K8R32_03670 [bacterium]|nr:hypothetical protein [bacterium]